MRVRLYWLLRRPENVAEYEGPPPERGDFVRHPDISGRVVSRVLSWDGGSPPHWRIYVDAESEDEAPDR